MECPVRVDVSLKLLLLVPLLLAGCGAADRGLVTGKVTFDDGRPVAAGEVLLTPSEDPSLPAPIGHLQADGTFELFTATPGDGAPLGKYHVLVMPLADDFGPKNPRPIDPKFADPKSSGIEFEILPGESTLNISVHPPKK